MYKPIFLFLLAFIAANTSYSQAVFCAGSISSDRQRTEGLIKYQNWSKNPISIVFRSAEGGLERKGFRDIEGFEVVRPDGNKEIYVRFECFYDASLTGLNDLEFTPQPLLKKDTFFLRMLVSGKISLYDLKDASGKRHFFIKKDGDTVQELYQKRYYLNKDQKEYRNSDQYKNQLTSLMKDSRAVTNEQIMKTAHSSGSLINLVNNYNGNAPASKSSYNFKKEKNHVDLFLVGGIGSTELKFKSDDKNSDLMNQHFNRSTTFAAGAGIVAYIPRTKNLLGVRAELFYNAYKVKSNGDRYEVTDGWIETDYELGFRTFKLNIGLQYFILKKNWLALYAAAGISNGLNSQTVNGFHQNRSFYGIESEKFETAFPDYRKYEQGYFFSLGGRYKRFGLECRLTKTNGFSSYSGLNTGITSFYGLVSYNFIH